MATLTATGFPGQLTASFDPARALASAGGIGGSNATPTSETATITSLLSRETGNDHSSSNLQRVLVCPTVVEKGARRLSERPRETDGSLRVAPLSVSGDPVREPGQPLRRARGTPPAGRNGLR